ncbi:hypothetical protein HDV00_010483 [Rhizophlyctis rosea]|nr:hypothetical protein HDV00_010483 [Rhizophlyctis rosea]
MPRLRSIKIYNIHDLSNGSTRTLDTLSQCSVSKFTWKGMCWQRVLSSLTTAACQSLTSVCLSWSYPESDDPFDTTYDDDFYLTEAAFKQLTTGLARLPNLTCLRIDHGLHLNDEYDVPFRCDDIGRILSHTCSKLETFGFAVDDWDKEQVRAGLAKHSQLRVAVIVVQRPFNDDTNRYRRTPELEEWEKDAANFARELEEELKIRKSSNTSADIGSRPLNDAAGAVHRQACTSPPDIFQLSHSRTLQTPETPPPPTNPTPHIVFETKGNAGIIKLTRPRAHNALTEEMIDAITRQLQEWDKSDLKVIIIMKGDECKEFCAGGDIKAIASYAAQNDAEGQRQALRFLQKQYAMNHLIATLDTPIVSIINVGAGLGLSMHVPFRIASENTDVSISEGAIGFFPGSGMSFFLSRLPDGSRVGKYVALTGIRLRAMETVMAGIATDLIPEERMPAFIERLCATESSDIRAINLITDQFVSGSPSEKDWEEWGLNGHLQKAFERCFKNENLEEIFEALEKEDTEWARNTLEQMKKYSPTYLKVVVEELKRGKKLDLAACFRMEYRIAKAFLKSRDLQTGVKAVLVDKTSETPEWDPTLETVRKGEALSDAEVRETFFDGAVEDESVLELLEDRTFMDYLHRTVTGLPREEDVKNVVTGEVTAGSFAMTTEEVLEWFAENWGGFLDPVTLGPLNELPEGVGAGKQFLTQGKDPLAASSARGKRAEAWLVRQRVAAILAMRTDRIGDNKEFLRWKRK